MMIILYLLSSVFLIKLNFSFAMDSKFTLIKDRFPSNSNKTFIIAEIGQNHQGDINTAKRLIKAAKQNGADCVKFQKTNLEEKFNKAALNRAYSSNHSWGETYGEHKKYLEFSEEQFRVLQSFAKEIGVLFTASAMDTKSLQFLFNIDVPFIKIGSGDANNFPLIKRAASMNKPLVISTGMQNMKTVKKIYEIVSEFHKDFCLMHCVSAYPTPINEINLNVIKLYQTEFPDIIIGYSGHELGIDISTYAVAIGARIVERHLTLDKTQKGSDHACSLSPQEFGDMVKKIRQLEAALGGHEKKIQPSEKNCYDKLGKTIVMAIDRRKGNVLSEDDVKIKVAEPKGIDGSEMDQVIGKKLASDVSADESLLFSHLID